MIMAASTAMTTPMTSVSRALAGLVSASTIVRRNWSSEPSVVIGPPMSVWISALPKAMSSRHIGRAKFAPMMPISRRGASSATP
ncbi:hypothetical protein [Micromonospora sp. NPDC003816]|uniref:hypothetical protein n=1 Tax=Micromonospora sp. NPDC003816 TaxID=3364224 RepID=UPI0036C47AAD